MSRQAGVLIPLFSLRSASSFGVGEIPDLVPFARWARASGFSVLQVLPVNEVSRGQHSPYGALSAFALDPVYVGLNALEDFVLAGGERALSPEVRRALETVRDSRQVQWTEVRRVKALALEIAFERFVKEEWNRQSARALALLAFERENASWVDDYALFVALHDENGGRPFTEWPAPSRDREPVALADAHARHGQRLLFLNWLQWQLDLQWREARREANRAGVELAGDLPFMVAGDSADVWSRPKDFRTDARVGVPPDAFSATGQDWGLPVYRWDAMAKEGYPWLSARAARMAELYDVYRVDHVIGLYRTYFFPNDGSAPAFVPDKEPDQVKNGEQVLAVLSRGARIIAEDLGVVPDFARASLARLGIPGYRVQRWEREWKILGQPYRDPALWPAVSVAATGTHDTESLADWYESLDPAERQALLGVPALASLKERAPAAFDEGVRDALLDMVYGAGSDLLLLPFQDAFGARDRVNVPGTVTDANWTYRIPVDLTTLWADGRSRNRLSSLASRNGRRPAG